ncbi:max-binding protein MNT-like, partial [Agrilus planipennis]|uniref:Max-binding protein MNT-like n=1 Tax=Agrilus planipennis TaxID=224129 RepID=A0A1W4XES8_AGRPL
SFVRPVLDLSSSFGGSAGKIFNLNLILTYRIPFQILGVLWYFITTVSCDIAPGINAYLPPVKPDFPHQKPPPEPPYLPPKLPTPSPPAPTPKIYVPPVPPQRPPTPPPPPRPPLPPSRPPIPPPVYPPPRPSIPPVGPPVRPPPRPSPRPPPYLPPIPGPGPRPPAPPPPTPRPPSFPGPAPYPPPGPPSFPGPTPKPPGRYVPPPSGPGPRPTPGPTPRPPQIPGPGPKPPGPYIPPPGPRNQPPGTGGGEVNSISKLLNFKVCVQDIPVVHLADHLYHHNHQDVHSPQEALVRVIQEYHRYQQAPLVAHLFQEDPVLAIRVYRLHHPQGDLLPQEGPVLDIQEDQHLRDDPIPQEDPVLDIQLVDRAYQVGHHNQEATHLDTLLAGPLHLHLTDRQYQEDIDPDIPLAGPPPHPLVDRQHHEVHRQLNATLLPPVVMITQNQQVLSSQPGLQRGHQRDLRHIRLDLLRDPRHTSHRLDPPRLPVRDNPIRLAGDTTTPSHQIDSKTAKSTPPAGGTSTRNQY